VFDTIIDTRSELAAGRELTTDITLLSYGTTREPTVISTYRVNHPTQLFAHNVQQ
jgi:hypothetical protein